MSEDGVPEGEFVLDAVIVELCGLIVQGYSTARTVDRITAWAARLLGVAHAELAVDDGSVLRVVSVAGDLQWTLGRTAASDSALPARLGQTDSGQTLPVHELAASSASVLIEAGFTSVTMAVVARPRKGGSISLGGLHRAGEPEPTTDQRRSLQVLTALAAAVETAASMSDPAVERLPDLAVTEPVGVRQRTDDAGERDARLDLFSHELRTPVTVVQGFLDTLVDRWDGLTDAERREGLGVVRERTRRLRALLDRLVESIRRDTDVELATVPVDAGAALRRVAERFAAPGAERSVNVQAGSGLLVLADEVALDSVLEELVTNAAKYSAPDAPLELAATRGAHGWVVLEVRDRGIGIHRADRERVFLRFWQGQQDAARRSGGVGLGLFLVRRLVAQQHGVVVVRPRDGGGTAVQVHLRAAPDG